MSFAYPRFARFGAGAVLVLAGVHLDPVDARAQGANAPLFYDQRRLPDLEVERRNQEVMAEQRRIAEEKRRNAEALARTQAEGARQAQEDTRIAAEADAKRQADEEKRIAAEADAKSKADEDKRIAAEADAKRKADDDKRIAAEADAKRKADEDKRIAAEADAKRKADDDKRIAAEADAKRKADDDKRIAAEADAKRKADDDKRIAAEADAKRKADDDKRIAAEADAKRKADDDKRIAAAAAQPVAQQAAALVPAVIAPPAAPPAACEPAKIAAVATPGGLSQITIDSPCRRGQTVAVHYGAYDLARKLGPNGHASFALDLFLGAKAPLQLGFADGNAQSVTLPAADPGQYSKIALIWQAPVSLDLHAIESGGSFGKALHRWPGAPSSLDIAVTEAAARGFGSGFISTSDDGAHDGSRIEVYTFVHSPDQESGAVAMLVDYASRGATPTGDKCGAGALAEIPFDVVVLDRKGKIRTESSLIPAQPCGVPLAAGARYLRGAVPDLRFRN